MGLKEWWNKKQQDWAEADVKEKEYRNNVNDLLGKFEIGKLQDFLEKYLNNKPEVIIDEDKDGRKIEKKPSRKDYLDFIWKYLDKQEINYNQIKDFALREKIVVRSDFGVESAEAGKQNEFESMMNAIRKDFQPENITDEEHLEAQLTIFLKAKFPDMKIERQIDTKSGDTLDILVNNKYVFELKVPKNKGELRDLSAQLDEYKEEYPYICAIVADISGSRPDLVTVNTNITQLIKDYVDKYKEKHVPSLVFNVKKRG